MKPAVVVETGTILVLVYYPYRKSPDCYGAIPGHTIHCLECDADGPEVRPEKERSTAAGEWLLAHIDQHDRRKRKKVR